MNALVRGMYLLAILSSTIAAFGQSGSPQTALEEMATADNLETVLRHLPPSFERTIRRMSPDQRASIENELLIQNKMKAEGLELQRGSDGSTWELTGPGDPGDANGAPAPRKKIVLTIQSAAENGNDALLLIDAREEATDNQTIPKRRESALAWMKFEDGDWRISEVGVVERVRVEDLLSKGVDVDSTPAAREASAVGALRTLNTAIVTYEATYQNVGVPPSISALTCASDETCKNPSAEHAALIDSTFAASPLIRSGYEFQYTRISSERYIITATPIDTDSATTPRSFFTDQSGVIRSTQENRAATPQDPALQ